MLLISDKREKMIEVYTKINKSNECLQDVRHAYGRIEVVKRLAVAMITTFPHSKIYPTPFFTHRTKTRSQASKPSSTVNFDRCCLLLLVL